MEPAPRFSRSAAVSCGKCSKRAQRHLIRGVGQWALCAREHLPHETAALRIYGAVTILRTIQLGVAFFTTIWRSSCFFLPSSS